MKQDIIEIVKERMNQRGNNISQFGCNNNSAIKINKELKEDIRPSFFRDIDRIIYSLSYTRYTDKTQVFSLIENDHISKRMTHVQMVSKIARTIGRALNLNEDLIEAASLGHDLGHVPFGHVGERELNTLSLEHDQKYFAHNVQSMRILYELENNGMGSNITIQTLDAILCHNGEKLLQKYIPKNKTKEELINEYNLCFTDKAVLNNLTPMTLEGCVVRVSDVIAYIGKDIEDGIRQGLIKKDYIPKDISDVLGNNNSEIVNNIVVDIINESFDKPYIKMSDKVYKSLQKLIKYNYQNIYSKANTEEQYSLYHEMYTELFTKYVNDLNNNYASEIYQDFLNNMSKEYLDKTNDYRKIIDFIAGMTDDYMLKKYNNINNISYNKKEV